MKVTLINANCNLQRVLGVGQEFIQKFEPLGLLSIATVLRNAGHVVTIIDADNQDYTVAETVRQVVEANPTIVGISVLTAAGEYSWDLGQQIKKELPQLPLFMGNIHAEAFAAAYLENNCCDYVIHGEGEYLILDLITHVLSGRIGGTGLKGISYRDYGGQAVLWAGERIVVADLDALPIPDRQLLNQRQYTTSEISNDSSFGGKRHIVKSMISSRGCVNKCIFCVVHHNQAPRFHSALRVIDEMVLLQNDYGAKHIQIQDSLFFYDKSRVLEICRWYKVKGLSVTWSCDAHVQHIDKEIIMAIARAGCVELSIGIESGVQRLLDKINKNITLVTIENAVKLIKKYSRIKLTGLFILGIPSETYADSLQTIAFAKKLPLDMAQFSIFTPYPGSPYFSFLRKRKEINIGISEKGDLARGVWQRYSSYPLFTDVELIWQTDTLTRYELIGLQKRALREFYLRPKQIWANLKRVRWHNIGQLMAIVKKGMW